jgi:hypothetical protein
LITLSLSLHPYLNSGSQAADFGRPSAVMPAAPAFNWTGFYLGGSFGGRWSDVTWTTSGPFILDPSTTPARLSGLQLVIFTFMGCGRGRGPLVHTEVRLRLRPPRRWIARRSRKEPTEGSAVDWAS